MISRSVFTARFGVGLFLLTLLLLLSVTAAAEAQDITANQYGDLAASGAGAIESADPPDGAAGDPANGAGTSGGSAGLTGSGGGAGTSGGSAGVLGLSILPETGGPLFSFIALGAIALSSGGLLAVRRTRGGR